MARQGRILPSAQKIRIVHVFETQPKQWFTNNEVAAAAKVARRTARHHTARLVKIGVLECAEVFGGYRFRWSPKAGHAALIAQLKRAASVYGLHYCREAVK
jgi:hypothetical protein